MRYPSNFYGKVLSSNGLDEFRNLGSKYEYMSKNKNHIVIFFGHITSEDEFIWSGDIDLTLDSEKVDKASKQLRKELVVSDGSYKEIYSTKSGFSKDYQEIVELVNGEYINKFGSSGISVDYV